jgi:Lrp/AsnC family transcriptional regulator, regulator for asnA, asnC and gidA
MIDVIDKKIIKQLSKDGRYSYNKLAKETGISIITLTKRIAKMSEDGFISIRAVPNPFKMGYTANAAIVIYGDFSQLDKLCSKIAQYPCTSIVITTFGKYNIFLLAHFLRWEMLQDFVRDVIPNIEGVIQFDTYFVSEVTKRFQGMFSNISQSKPAKIDKIDEIIIEELSKNGRTSCVDLGKMLGINSTTVSRRAASLIKNQVIKIIAVPSLDKFGYTSSAWIFLKTDLGKIDTICNELSQHPKIHMVMKLMNGSNILAGIMAVNLEELHKIITSNVASIPGVLKVESIIRAEVKKTSLATPLLIESQLS